MRYCYAKKQYYVSCQWYDFSGGGRNFIRTPSLGRARYFARKLPRKIRQIDVRIWGQKPYVLNKSWL